jgi:hypothetical protein|tara:strand:- start:60 stop:314 length:255 start_codon:yes stop_codon:yes gene_type:complete
MGGGAILGVGGGGSSGPSPAEDTDGLDSYIGADTAVNGGSFQCSCCLAGDADADAVVCGFCDRCAPPGDDRLAGDALAAAATAA